jgi:hypothetical protein
VITDIFARRYANVPLRSQYFDEDRRFMNQAAVMLMDPLWTGYKTDKITDAAEAGLKSSHDLLAMELGREYLGDRYWFQTYTFNGNTNTQAHTYTYANICKNFLIKMPDDVAKGDAWVKDRLSLVEIAFRMRGHQVAFANAELPKAIAKADLEDGRRPPAGSIRLPGRRADGVRAVNAQINAAFDELVRDLNERLRLAQYKLTYHNGFIQLFEDETVNATVAAPFWQLVGTAPWDNVDLQMKEAIDRRDNGDRMAAFHAVCALESCIKIISDLKGWTTNNQNGAASYVSNLVSQKNGRFIEVWEGDMLTKMFSDVRNPFAHGPGQSPMPTLSPEQTNWTIETAMTWIKSLVRRFYAKIL